MKKRQINTRSILDKLPKRRTEDLINEVFLLVNLELKVSLRRSVWQKLLFSFLYFFFFWFSLCFIEVCAYFVLLSVRIADVFLLIRREINS